MARVAVVGAGAWGTALAAHAARLGHQVRLWALEAEVVRDVQSRHENSLFLPDVRLRWRDVMVAQSEHSLYLGPGGVEVLTANG